MNKLPSKYKHRYWVQQNAYTYVFYFSTFEERELIRFFIPSSKFEREYVYESYLLNIVHDTIEADSPEEAMSMLEQMVNDYFEDQYNYYQELLEMFGELDNVVAYNDTSKTQSKKENNKMTGTVKWFDKKKGYGFITVEGEKEVFVHYSNIKVKGFKCLKEGQNVEFDTKMNNDKPQAVNVKILPRNKEKGEKND